MRQAVTVLAVVGAASVALAGSDTFSTGPQTFTGVTTFTFTKADDGQTVAGFSVWVDYIGDGGNTWASDTNLMITAPDGQTVSIGGFGSPADLDYDYQGSVSAGPGVYMSGPHTGWIDGGPNGGTYTLKMTQDFGIGFFNDFSVHIIRVPAPGAAALLGLGGLVAVRRRR